MSLASFRQWAVMTGCVLLVAATRMAPAQLPQSFSVIPDDATNIVRVDVDALESHPMIGPELKARTDANPDYWPDLLAHFDGNSTSDEGRFPGKIRIIEAGAALDVDLDDPPTYTVLFGHWERANIIAWIEGRGMQQSAMHMGSPVYTREDGSAGAAAIPNDGAVIMAKNTELVTRVLDTWAGSRTSVRATEAPLGPLSGGAENALIYFAIKLPAAARQRLEEMAMEIAADPGTATMLGPAVPAMQALVGLESLVISVPAQEDTSANVALIFTSPEYSVQFTQGFANTMQMVQQISTMMAQSDPQRAAEVQRIAAIRFTAADNRALGRVPFDAKDFFGAIDQFGAIRGRAIDGLPPMPGMPGSKQ